MNIKKAVENLKTNNMEKTLAEFFKHDFSKGTFRLYDKNDNVIYSENSKGYWFRSEYDENGNRDLL